MPADTVPLNGYAVQALREARLKSKTELADETGIVLSYISELESGAKKTITLPTLRKIAAALEVDHRALLATTRSHPRDMDAHAKAAS